MLCLVVVGCDLVDGRHGKQLLPMAVASAVEHLTDQPVDAGSTHQHARPGVIQHVADLGRSEPVVERHEDRPEASGCEERLERGDVVETQVGHPVPVADAARSK